jgi:putative membrane protein
MWCDWNTMGFFGWTMMVLVWGAVIFALVWGIRTARDTDKSSDADAVRVLERRYALGEIDRDEFEERRRLLDDSHKSSR